MSSLQTTLWKALGGGAVAFGLLGLVEGGLRLAGVPDPGLYTGDPAVLWYLGEDLHRDVAFGADSFLVETSELGLRGASPPADGPWTLALGCSTTFGWGVSAEDAWPARLGELLGEPVINGGIPGWSTEQARRGVARFLALGPSRVVVAYGVRDAWPALREDAAARPTPWWLRTSLARLLRGGVRGGASGASGGGSVARPEPTTRVPPPRFDENLAAMEALAGEVELVWLAFPQPEPLPQWEAVLARREGALLPRLPREDFFPDDPVHLTAEGHEHLAAWLAEQPPFGGLSSPEGPDLPP